MHELRHSDVLCSVLGPRLRNCLLRLLTLATTFFKDIFLSEYIQRIRGFGDYVAYKSMFYLLTYLHS